MCAQGTDEGRQCPLCGARGAAGLEALRESWLPCGLAVVCGRAGLKAGATGCGRQCPL